MPRTSWKMIAQHDICLPPQQVVRTLQSISQWPIDQMNASIHQNLTLDTNRNLVLPKLMSGRIRVPETEKSLAAVV